jgi:hypothetical protein
MRPPPTSRPNHNLSARMKFLPFCLAILTAWPALLPAADPSPARSLVYVAATSQPYRFLQPWDKSQPQRKRGLGAILPGGRVLVTAELTADSTYIELERPADGAKATARVVARDYECNLAVLEPANGNGSFLDGTVPLEVAGPAKAGDALEVWQLEDDGSPVITEGRLARVETGPYFLPDRAFLRYQFKGSLQNKAGSFIVPAVREGKLAGLLLGYNANDQVADVLPAPIIRLFLDDAADGELQGFAALGLRYSRTTDSQFRRWLGLPDNAGGVYLGKITRPGSAASAGFRDGDVLLELDGFAIDRRGYYNDPDFGLLNFGHIATGRRKVGDTLAAVVWRDKNRLEIPLKLERRAADEFLVDPWMFDRGPRYLVAGGIVFTELTKPFLRSFREGEKNAPVRLRYVDANQEEFMEGREKVVILAYMIPTPATLGYEKITTAIVEEANGKPVGSIRDLHAALMQPAKGIHSIKVEGSNPVIHIDAAIAEAVDQQLMSQGVQPLSRLE